MTSPLVTSNTVSSDSGQTPILLKDLGQNDVLLGRGTGPNEHIGNIRYRAFVREVIKTSELHAIDGKTKTKLAAKIVDSVKARNGRFVKRVNDFYQEVPDSLALDKTKQSFRHQLRAIIPPSNGSRFPNAIPFDKNQKSLWGSGVRSVAVSAPVPSIDYMACGLLELKNSLLVPRRGLSSLAGMTGSSTSRIAEELAMLDAVLGPRRPPALPSFYLAHARRSAEEQSYLLSSLITQDRMAGFPQSRFPQRAGRPNASAILDSVLDEVLHLR
jgi:hypothetical protein